MRTAYEDMEAFLMNSVAKRLILTFTTVPALLLFMYFLPHQDHLAFALLTVAAMVSATREMHRIFIPWAKVNIFQYAGYSLFPFILYLEKHFHLSFPLTGVYGILLILIIFTVEIFRGERDQFEKSIEKISRHLLLFTYPAVFSLFLILILFLDHAGNLLLLLFSVVFANDSLAYVFGMLLGKRNRNILKVSPNKSIAGFIGGIIGAIAASFLYYLLSPVIHTMFTPLSLVILSVVSALAGDVGDLVESMFKRNAGIKDSGTMILGRGGLMDSIDSLLCVAPLFYYIVLYIQMGQ